MPGTQAIPSLTMPNMRLLLPSLSSECQIQLTDFGTTTKSLSLPVSYCPSNIPLDLRISAAEANAALAEGNSDYNYELTDVLAREVRITPL